MGRYRRLLSNTAIFGVGTFASKLLVFLLMPFYTSILSASQFGEADIITQTANLIIPLAAVGICDGIFRFSLDGNREENGINRKEIFSTGIIILSMGSAVALAGIQLLRFIDILSGSVMLIAVYVICANFHTAVANFLRAEGRTKLFAAQGILNTVLTIAYNIIFLLVFNMGVTGYVLSVVVADLTTTVFLVFFAKVYRSFSPRSFSRATAKAMLKFSIPYIPTTMMWLITSASDRYIVTAYCGSAENGLYAAAYKLPTLITLVCTVFIEAWQFSTVSDADEGERSEFFGKVYKYFMGIIFMGGSGLIVTAKIFTDLLLADSYYTSWKYVPVLAIALVFSSLVSFLGSVYFVEKKSIMSMLTAMSGAVINVILNFVFIPRFGAMGAAAATLISYASVYAIRAYDTRLYIKFKLHTVRVILNTLILFVQAIIMISEVRYWYIAEFALVLAVLVINGREIIGGVKNFLQNFSKKDKKI